jgi:uncharacterized protein involved in exopolysaccharide biosynthesis
MAMSEKEIDLKEYIRVILKRRLTIILSVVIFTGLAFLLSVTQKPTYEAKTTLLLRSSGFSASSQFAGLAGLAGINLSGSGKNLQDLVGLIRSDAVARSVLEGLRLRDRIEGWDRPYMTEQRLVTSVRNILKMPELDGNLLELRVEFSDPNLAAEIANGYVAALTASWNKLNFTEAKKKKEYIESQLPRVESELKTAEEKYKRFTLLSPQKNSSLPANLLGMSSSSPSQGIEAARLARELDIQNNVYTMLRREYEQVKLDESKEIPPFSVIDRAVKPEFRSRPKTKLNMMVGFTIGLLAGILLAFFKEYWESGEGGQA